MSSSKTVSGFISQIAKTLAVTEDRQSRIQKIIDACHAMGADELPPVEYVNIIGSPDHAHFKSVMCGLFSEFARGFNFEPDSNILDIGCGCGRMAFPFAKFLKSGKYYGIDVWREGIDWCTDNLAAAHPNMQFVTMESKNNYYIDKLDPNVRNAYKLPFIADDFIDFAFAISVFTHLTEADSQAYLDELSRILRKDGGAAYLTCFIIDDFFFRFRERTGMHEAVTQTAEGCWHAYEGQDFFAGFSNEKWRAMMDAAGLRIVSQAVGSWAEKPGALNYQDTFVVVHA